MANRLSKETSPYLLQHANNPVDWYPWSTEALEKAKADDKPILVSIGYAACHWCHVMEKESFEEKETADIMNRHFINIKVDREERPDVDHIYMDAVQAITGSGGWPLNVFLTPEGKPFYGGTYFPPTRAYNRSSWKEVLLAVAKSYTEKRGEIDMQAENLTEHLQSSNLGIHAANRTMKAPQLDDAFRNIMKSADKVWGGFGQAPKFPQTFTINFLLNYAFITKNNEALEQATISLDKMIQGGMFDHIGGGFARYSTDTEWLVPHFEKMLYDNALLVSTLADAYKLTGKKEYKIAIEETLKFIERELMNDNGGFFSALDADSEGEEGKFYIWSYNEVKTILGTDSDVFCQYFDITQQGNWEGKNIPRVLKPFDVFVIENKIQETELATLLQKGKGRLLNERSRRIRPMLDNKILLSWNALMNIAYTKAYAATGNEGYIEVAKKNMSFLLSAFGENDQNLHHTWQQGQAKQPPFLEDYSYLIAALIELAQLIPDYNYLQRAATLVQIVEENYGDPSTLFYYYTSKDQGDIIIRKKEIYDGAIPSANAIMLSNLHKLGILLDNQDWLKKAGGMMMAIGEAPVRYPTSFGVWLLAAYEIMQGTTELAVIGSEWKSRLSDLQKNFIPFVVMMASCDANDQYPLLAGKKKERKTHIFLCHNYNCQQPLVELKEVLSLIGSNNL